MRPPSNVLTQYIEGLATFWAQRSTALIGPRFRLSDLTKLDLRLEAHIDGLRVAGDEGWTLVRRELAWREPGEVFAAAVLALDPVSASYPERLAEVFTVVEKKPALAQGLISALGWLPWPQAEPHARRLAASSRSWKQRTGIAAFAVHRQDPGPLLEEACQAESPWVRARAARAAGELGRVDLVSLVQNDLYSADPDCRFWAAWAVALLAGYTRAIEVLQEIAGRPGRYQEGAFALALRVLRTQDAFAWQRQIARTMPRLAILGAGVLGDPVLVPFVLEHLADPMLARVAGESFTTITGVDLAYQSLDRRKPEGFEPGPSEDPNDEDVSLDPDDRLPWPNPPLVARWWEANRQRFVPGERYLLGRVIADDSLQEALRTGKQRQRAAAALELALRHRGQPLFEVRAPGFRQQRLLGLGRRPGGVR